jgi:glutamyl-tRNA synthetase
MERYQAEVKRLLEAGHAYRDYARPEELQEQREAAEREGRPFLYDRKWMARDQAHANQLEAEGRTAAVRLKMPREGQCTFHDVVRGDVAFDWAQEQDHVVQRADGTCLYHLASVVDDHDFRITHVVRAVEHLPNTPRQIFIAQSLGYPLPVYAHLPYVAEPGGSAKMSKRKLDKYLKQKDFASLYQHGEQIAQKMGWKISPATFNPVVVDFYRAIGFLPEAILNYLLLLGWSLDDSTESFTMDEATEAFSLERVQKSPASFDCQKLLAFQSRWMQRISAERRRELVWGYLSHLGWMPPLASASPSQIAKIDRLLSDRKPTFHRPGGVGEAVSQRPCRTKTTCRLPSLPHRLGWYLEGRFVGSKHEAVVGTTRGQVRTTGTRLAIGGHRKKLRGGAVRGAGAVGRRNLAAKDRTGDAVQWIAFQLVPPTFCVFCYHSMYAGVLDG